MTKKGITINFTDTSHIYVQIRSFFWSVFSRIRTRKNSVSGHFLRSGSNWLSLLKASRWDILIEDSPWFQQLQYSHLYHNLHYSHHNELSDNSLQGYLLPVNLVGVNKRTRAAVSASKSTYLASISLDILFVISLKIVKFFTCFILITLSHFIWEVTFCKRIFDCFTS